LYYFVKLKGMNLQETDNRGSTPLHWACYSKSEFALNYILAMDP
jgi:ankyrin repeat protein